jgi:hypothetical protein
LAQGEPSPVALGAAQRRAEEEHAHTSLLLGLRGERAAVADTVRAWEKGWLPTEEVDQALFFNTTPKEVTGYEVIDRGLQYLRGGEWDRRLAAAHLRYLTRFIEYVKRAPDGLRAEELAVVQSLAPPELQKTEIRKILVSAEKEAVVACRTRAMLAVAAVALAAERFRRERGRWPESVGELVPGHLRSHPVDPFDGRPLRFRRLTDGLVIYSVGENGADDGGQVRFDPWAYQYLDVGLRLWDVAQRRQEPPPLAAGPN